MSTSEETGNLSPADYWHERFDSAKHEVDAVRQALLLILPMAKAYAHQHDVGSNKLYIELAERVLAGAAGGLTWGFVYECIACEWSGRKEETSCAKHDREQRLCPECHEVVEIVYEFRSD